MFLPLCGLMCYQVTWCREALVTLYALKWLLSHVGPLIFLQAASYWEALVAFLHLKGFFILCGTSHNSITGLILRSSCHTSSIAKVSLLCWSSHAPSTNLILRSSCFHCVRLSGISCMGPLMFLQVACYWEALVALWAFKRLLSCVGPLMLLQGTWSWCQLLSKYPKISLVRPKV